MDKERAETPPLPNGVSPATRRGKGANMDDTRFDRLSVVVDKLRTGASRRETLRLLLAGSLAAAAATVEDAEAKKKKHKNRNKNSCRGWGSRCSRNKDCCNGRCRSGVCQLNNGNWWNGNPGNGGTRCRTPGGTITCLPGYECSTVAGVHVCVPKGYNVCCGNNCFSNDWNWKCCGNSSWGFQGGCPSSMRCCSTRYGARCCPSGMRCSNAGCWPRTASRAARAAGTAPVPKPTFGDDAWVTVTPGEGVASRDGQPAPH
ncbi:MAG: hypothetical protein IT337_08390 [Thermomicrobiales bacterium]|nr:hypothetical protein [Thermomicrobiales bacterium]